MQKHLPLVIVLFAMCGFAAAQPQIAMDKIKQIKLLESSRDDVRNILASYEMNAQEEYYYDRFSNHGAKISVKYSKGNCRELSTDDFRVPEWKAIKVSIEFDEPIKLRKLKIDLSKFKKELIYYDIDNYYVYHDKQAGIVLTVNEGEIQQIDFIPVAGYYNLMCDQEKAKILSASKSIYELPLKERSGIPFCGFANVAGLNLSRTEILTECDPSVSRDAKVCPESATIIDISTITASASDPLTYRYTTSAGKIIGKGARVQWDLTGVRPGVYTIKAEVDNGCDFCGKSQTKQVVVKQCPGCQ